MPDKDEDRCSAPVVLLCTKSRQLATITYCETTDRETASNYRGELIGAVLATTTLKVVSEYDHYNYTTPVMIYCDNLGVVTHGNNFVRSLPEKQVHLDLLSALRRNISTLPMRIIYQHVKAHMDDHILFQELPLPQQLNVIADTMAKEALCKGIHCQTKFGPEYTGEVLSLYLSGRKITALVRRRLYAHWGQEVARDLFQKR
jgi:hypothetical protein